MPVGSSSSAVFPNSFSGEKLQAFLNDNISSILDYATHNFCEELFTFTNTEQNLSDHDYNTEELLN